MSDPRRLGQNDGPRNHSAIVKLTLIESTQKGWRLFKNTIYAGWTGQLRREWREEKDGVCVELKGAIWRTFGLGTDTLDLVGWRPLRITADMVGRVIAQYVEVDAKTPSYRRMSPGQRNRARVVREAGGFAGVAQRVEEAPGRVAIAEIGEE